MTPLRLGIVDFDTSHAVEFPRRINHVGVEQSYWVEGARVVAGCPGHSRMAPERIAANRQAVIDCGVEICERREELLPRIDAAMIVSLEGNAHREHAEFFLRNGKPVFVDKPFAGSMDDAAAMLNLARRMKLLLLHASALRYSAEVLGFREAHCVRGRLSGLTAWGPGHRHAGNPGLLHYGVHTVEMTYALMGPGCREVSCLDGRECDVIHAVWNEGRHVTVRLLRGKSRGYGFVGFTDGGEIPVSVSTQHCYRNLCQQVVDAFRGEKELVPYAEIAEVTQFLLAANESAARNGSAVKIEPMELEIG